MANESESAAPTELAPVRQGAEEARIARLGYFWIVLVNLAVIVISYSTPSAALIAYLVLSVPLGLGVLVATFRRGRALVTPLTLYSVVWLVAMPMTSVPAPLMRSMSPEEVRLCALFGLVFCLVGLVMSSISLNAPRVSRLDAAYQRRLAVYAEWLLALSVAALLVNVVLEGRVALLDAGSADRKAVAQFYGFPILASIGSISLCLLAYSRKMSRRALTLTAIYLTLQLLTGQRFVTVLSLILVVAVVSSTRSLSRNEVRRIVLLVVGLVIAFLFVSSFRGGSEDQYEFFIRTGLYGGDPAVLQWTEIVRYFGMGQRNLEQVFASTGSLATERAEYSFAPITSLFGEPPAPLGTSTYGYTATNIIGYLYRDFGTFWLAAVAAISWIVHVSYRRLSTDLNVTTVFLWAVCTLAMATSFFAYVNAYVYWVLLFPAIVLLLDRQARSTEV